MSETENCYALLTNIQGFDSFSLGPHSSQEEIARAFQTQVRRRAANPMRWYDCNHCGAVCARVRASCLVAALSVALSHGVLDGGSFVRFG